MTAQVWKRGPAQASVTFRCPWCDVVGASPVVGHHEDRRDVWLLIGCPNVGCRRGVMVRVPRGSPWSALETPEEGILLGDACVHPRDARDGGWLDRVTRGSGRGRRRTGR